MYVFSKHEINRIVGSRRKDSVNGAVTKFYCIQIEF